MNASNQKPRKADEPDQGTQTPKRPTHSDDERSAMPERDDKSRRQSPSDHPGKRPGEGEPSVG
ncbi:hypothetical protein [Paraburkholderia lycopersici]|uniref:Uncharacterized protein n=1 Tax=Paraburkholderia lycopersici TaxID=416944 RepID=A0A1G6HI87_9BURK|nr:hypothetical protein [Paraburkholderia lycopersici]SDB93156.1 hypothetical protein SAMN05421548_102277 [Paraburkholderia lycopersici]